MAIHLTPKIIDEIIEQIEKLQQLAKVGILKANKEAEPFSFSATERCELDQFKIYEFYKKEIVELDRIRFGSKDPGSVVRKIDVYKRKLSQIPYDAKRSKELRAKLARWQGKYQKTLNRYFIKNIKSDWEQLEVFLYAHQEALCRFDSDTINHVLGLLDVKKSVVASDQQFENVTLILQKIKDRLVVERQQKPATRKPAETERNNTSSKGSRIGALLWKLYEKSLKVIVDSFLERVWPK